MLNISSNKDLISIDGKIFYNIFNSKFGFCFIAWQSEFILKVSLSDINNFNTDLTSLQIEFPLCKFEQNNNLNFDLFNPLTLKNYTIFLNGTDFQISVWKSILTIPFGETRTYHDIALDIGKTDKFCRAIGTAVGKNSIAYLTPCHRVVRKNGIIGEYRWGHALKKELLKWELENNSNKTTLL